MRPEAVRPERAANRFGLSSGDSDAWTNALPSQKGVEASCVAGRLSPRHTKSCLPWRCRRACRGPSPRLAKVTPASGDRPTVNPSAAMGKRYPPPRPPITSSVQPGWSGPGPGRTPTRAPSTTPASSRLQSAATQRSPTHSPESGSGRPRDAASSPTVAIGGSRRHTSWLPSGPSNKRRTGRAAQGQPGWPRTGGSHADQIESRAEIVFWRSSPTAVASSTRAS